MNKIRYFLCHYFGWYKPSEHIEFDEHGWHSKCKYCGRTIVQDENGKCF